ncbi:MAG TPA: WYL domain-containing protein [Azospirillaceae bacterium]|nr:WYL domain-containing protein [Azospirillaceae bacterium]
MGNDDTDRLLRLLAILSDRRPHERPDLAKRLETPPQAVEGDVARLQALGFPVMDDGRTIRLTRAGSAAPVQFTAGELWLLRVLFERLGEFDPDAWEATLDLQRKLATALPGVVPCPEWRDPGEDGLLAEDNFLADLAEAVAGRRKVTIDYLSGEEERTVRTVRPLHLEDWGRSFVLIAWCDLREDFRAFRLDRVMRLGLLRETFEPEPGRTLADYVRRTGGTERPGLRRG